MTSWAVADSGLYLAITFREPFAEKSALLIESWIQSSRRVAVPYLFHYELISVVRKHISRGNLTLQDGQTALQNLLQLKVEVFTEPTLLQRAFELANQHNRSTAYDCVYLALAEQLGCEFWTVDLRLFNAVSMNLPYVKWVGNFEEPQP